MLDRLKGRATALSLGAMVSIGFAFIAYGHSLPEYLDLDRANELKGIHACDENGVIPGWFDELYSLETLRYPLIQSGMSLILAAATIAALLGVFGNRQRPQILATPASIPVFFLLGCSAVGLSWFSQMISLDIDLGRGDFPWCADTIFIPMAELSIFYAGLLILCCAAGGLLAVKFQNLPVSLFAWRQDIPAKSWMVSLPFFLIGIVIILLGLDGAYRSTFLGTPAALISLYLTESARSALVCSLREPSHS
ncbi:hypothetical protein SAMN06297468_2906 [Altererythrobacter xiamenensis]|uniref:Uncharacterized protein n=1 Tax=Altererythrobacter xiamenensis TaxID=1316679 RepID=A0A1Y6FIR4_9SPHN|nr:hypothetical protein [Altererythrobacter xiamenensis]SMQ74735.1 hypothetical protein SAMN06297468_2906 [Altererythrobacter xiamenensis]